MSQMFKKMNHLKRATNALKNTHVAYEAHVLNQLRSARP